MKRQWISKIAFALMIALLVLTTLPALPARAATKTASVTGGWNNTSTWGGAAVPNSGDDVIINSGIIVTVPAGYSSACKSINFTTGTAGLASITLSDSTSSLTVSGPVTIQQQGSGGSVNQINVGAGTFSATAITLSATNDASRFSQILISSGIVNITGDVTSSGTASRITFSGAGRINVGGNFMSGTAGTFTPSTGTINFNAAGGQTVGAYAYNNLMLSGGGAKSIPAGTSVNGNLSITGSAKASVAAGQNISVGTLNLGGLGTANGTWGSTNSTATFKTDTYFAATTGYLTVTTDTRGSQSPLLVVTGPASVTYGTTGTITKTGGSGTGAVTYSDGPSTGCTVNPTSGEISVTTVSGNCVVTATKAADKNYLETTSDDFVVTLAPRPVTLTGTRPYDTTSLAAAAILSVTNKVGTDVVTVASGSATLASANVGSQPITSMGTLALGGAAAANYTLSGASGSVTITKADQASLVVTGPSSLIYGTSGTITFTGGSGTGTLSYSQGSSTGCTVNTSTGAITMTDLSGSCTVTVTRAADNNYNATTSAGFNVTLAPRPVTLAGTRKYDKTAVAAAGILSITNKVGADDVTVTSGSVTLASANAGPQLITSMGSLALAGPDVANYTLSGASGSVTITKADQVITFPAPASPAPYHSIFTVAPTSGSGLVVTVNASGVCTIVNYSVTMTSGAGTCTLTASQAGDANYNPASNVTQMVTAQKAEQAPLAVTGPASLTYGTTATIIFTGGSGLGAVSYSWITSNAGCKVNASTGLITVTDASLTCMVIVTKAGDDNYNLASSAGVVTLNKANQVPLAVTGPAAVTYGTTGTITFTGGSGTGTFSYSHGSSTGCTVNPSTGAITVTDASGSCNVTISRAADNNYLGTTSAGFGVTLNKAAGSVSINNIPGSAVYGGSFTPTFTKLGDGATFPVSLTSGTCTVTTAGVVNFIGLGTCTLQASVAEGTNHLAAWGTKQSFIIGKASQTISFTTQAPAGAIIGRAPYSPSASASSGLPVIITVDAEAGSVCTLSSGEVSFIGVGTCVLNANQQGNSNYNSAAQVQQSIVVTEGHWIYLPLMFLLGTP